MHSAGFRSSHRATGHLLTSSRSGARIHRRDEGDASPTGIQHFLGSEKYRQSLANCYNQKRSFYSKYIKKPLAIGFCRSPQGRGDYSTPQTRGVVLKKKWGTPETRLRQIV